MPSLLRHRDRSEHHRSRPDVAAVRRLLQLRHPAVEIGIGPRQFAFLHQPDFVVRGAGHLVLDGLAAGAVADGQALNAVLDELSVLGDVVGLRLGPLRVMTRIERVALGGIRQRRSAGLASLTAAGRTATLRAADRRPPRPAIRRA